MSVYLPCCVMTQRRRGDSAAHSRVPFCDAVHTAPVPSRRSAICHAPAKPIRRPTARSSGTSRAPIRIGSCWPTTRRSRCSMARMRTCHRRGTRSRRRWCRHGTMRSCMSTAASRSSTAATRHWRRCRNSPRASSPARAAPWHLQLEGAQARCDARRHRGIPHDDHAHRRQVQAVAEPRRCGSRARDRRTAGRGPCRRDRDGGVDGRLCAQGIDAGVRRHAGYDSTSGCGRRGSTRRVASRRKPSRQDRRASTASASRQRTLVQARRARRAASRWAGRGTSWWSRFPTGAAEPLTPRKLYREAPESVAAREAGNRAPEGRGCGSAPTMDGRPTKRDRRKLQEFLDEA